MFKGEYVTAPAKYIQSLLGSKWRVKQGNDGLLVPTVGGAIKRCMDGRKIKSMWPGNELTHGPAMQGATEGLALLLALQGGYAQVDGQDVERACRITRAQGFLPSVHDHSKEGVHCAHSALAYKGQFGVDMSIDPMELVQIINEHDGKTVYLAGKHQERSVKINFVTGTTILADNSAFVLDLWFARAIGLDRDLVLNNLILTLSGLGSQIHDVEIYSK